MIVHMVAHAVRAQKPYVSLLIVQPHHIRNHLGIGAQGPGDQIALGMHHGLLKGQFALFHQLAHQRMIPGQLHQRAVAQKIGPAVPHMGQTYAVLAHPKRGQRGAHALFGDIQLGGAIDRGVGRLHRVFHNFLIREPVFPELPHKLIHRHAAGHLARQMTAHAVRHYGKALLQLGQIIGVFIGPANQAHMAGRKCLHGFIPPRLSVFPFPPWRAA